MKSITHSPEETQSLAAKVINLAKDRQVNLLALYGNLGSGKTTFTQGLALDLGIKKNLISPTFVLIRQYPINSDSTWKTLYHVDLYRLASAAAIKSMDLEELWQDPQNLVIIEWAEKAKDILPPHRLNISFRLVGDNSREISYDFIHR